MEKENLSFDLESAQETLKKYELEKIKTDSQLIEARNDINSLISVVEE